jgi:outer membrane protein OmpA-like peptidoglycan-associated protein
MDKEHKGYLSSNRIGSVGYDDIYSFTKCNYIVEGFITDVKTGEILIDATVEIFDENNKKVTETKSNAIGKYSLAIECRENYTIRASKKDYESAEKMFATENANNLSIVNLALDRNVFLVETGTDLAKVFDISLIYFDLDKWNIRPDAAKDLEKIIAVMKQNPDMKVDIRSHTDSRQTHKYNETLSNRRAKATMDFMIKNGIDKSRLTAKGYGETELVNECKDNVPCSEAQHQKNRRSEFIILKM